MKPKRMLVAATLLRSTPALLAFLASIGLMLVSCETDRMAGSSTEAGNAGGKLSLSGGQPAAGVSVALVSRTYLPDTLAAHAADKPGAYYRTRTDSEGRFLVEGVVPGEYRVMAVGPGTGAMADSVTVVAGPDTAWVEEVLQPLGAILGVARLVGSDAKVHLWVRPMATVKLPPKADNSGNFRLDSLPEGDYDLVPECFTCAPSEKPYRVQVKSGRYTLMGDTLLLFPAYFHGFPDSGDYQVTASTFPGAWFEGKLGHGTQHDVLPLAVAWTWNGGPLPSVDVRKGNGIEGTKVLLDSLFGTLDRGRLQVTLTYADTTVSRAWTVSVNRSAGVWPLQAVEADSVRRIPGPEGEGLWSIRVAGVRPLAEADVAFWGLAGLVTEPRPGSLPEWVSLQVGKGELPVVSGQGPGRLTFILVPDSTFGGKVLRARRDERLVDFGNIRLLDPARLGFRDSLQPSMRPGALIVDRKRSVVIRQRYRIDSTGKVEALLGPIAITGLAPLNQAPLLFYRSGLAGSGFDWEKPARDAAKGLAVTREGRAHRLDGSLASDIPASELETLETLLGAMAQDPPVLPDTAEIPVTNRYLDYLHYRGRGLLRLASPGDTLFKAFEQWAQRNGLVEPPAYPLETDTLEFLGFGMDSGFHYNGDTLILALEKDGAGAVVRESLSPGSPSRLPGDTAQAVVYRLEQVGDTLVAFGGPPPAVSRLFGTIDRRKTLFAVAGLRTIAPTVENGLPILDGGGNLLSGRLDGDLAGWGRILSSPGILLDQRGIDLQGRGYLYTRENGLERAWRFGGRSGAINGWSRL